MMARPRTLVILVALSMVGGSPVPGSLRHGDGFGLVSQANARPRIRDLIARLRGETLPKGIIKSNGRIEATQVDVSAKYAGRLSEVRVEEGSSVTQGQVVAIITSPEYEAQLRAAQANLQQAREALTAAEAEIASRQSALVFAKADFERGAELIKSGTITKQTYDQRKRNYEAADAAVKTFVAQRDQAKSKIRNSEAEVDRVQSIINDLTLVAPRIGRVQYQLARSGEVVAAGAAILTILDLTDVYMTIFLPAAEAGRLSVGDEARIILDPVPNFVIPASVSFVASDAQFTPKTVETKDERAKLMFRIKLKIDPKVLEQFYTRVKTGVRGLGFVRTMSGVDWPADLHVKLPAPPAAKPAEAKVPDATAPPRTVAPAAPRPDVKAAGTKKHDVR